MIALLRRCRWLAALLLIASPAIGGQVLPLLHPCPVELPWVATAEHEAPAAVVAADDHAHHGHGGPATAPAEAPESHGHDGDQCSCIGSCHSPVAPALPTVQIALGAETAAPIGADWPVIEAAGVATRPVDLLPPKTAPPLV